MSTATTQPGEFGFESLLEQLCLDFPHFVCVGFVRVFKNPPNMFRRFIAKLPTGLDVSVNGL